ncbi:protein kinase domain-containing protein [Geoalkalibacter halelectricus]|uniref:protein kinase domain-containing protein n=1 Tax=Geoalkalibacter halelectricus TaxID=2847045 RepID=UPI003D22CE26
MSGSLLIFKEFLPRNQGTGNLADRVWIHPNGQTVVLLDGVSGCPDPVEAAQSCLDYLAQIETTGQTFNPAQLLLALHSHLQKRPGQMVVAACVQYGIGEATCTWAGNPRLYLFAEGQAESMLGEPLNQPVQALGMEGDIVPMTTSFSIPEGAICLLFSDGLSHQALMERQTAIRSAHRNLEWQHIGEESAVDDDWSLVVFPIEQTFSYVKNSWPYNPFVGSQEDYEHEKRGLAQLADALFAEEDFAGFRIVGGTRFVRANSSRLLDGVLVCPWGVVCLELKDHNSHIELPLHGRKEMSVRDGRSYRTESNPVAKVGEALRAFSTYDLGCELEGVFRKIGAVVFTHPDVEVACHAPDGARLNPPLTSAEVLVVTPTTLAAQLRKFVKQFVGKKGRPPLSHAEIEVICNKLAQPPNAEQAEGRSLRTIDRFQFVEQPNEEESTSYYQVYDGTFMHRDKKVWVKKFARAQLARGNQIQVEESRLREVEALRLFREGCIQQFLGREQADDGLFVILEQVEGPRLDHWLKSNPVREDRIGMLREVAGILVLLAEERLVHRSLSPHSVRVRVADGHPVLINFELCQMDVVATLPLSGRRLLDIQYAAKEVFTHGARVTCAADIYSFGKIICLALAGELPFESFETQIMAIKRPGFWQGFCRKCGLTDAQGRDLARMLSMNPEHRPSAQEVLTILEGWQ